MFSRGSDKPQGLWTRPGLEEGLISLGARVTDYDWGPCVMLASGVVPPFLALLAAFS